MLRRQLLPQFLDGSRFQNDPRKSRKRLLRQITHDRRLRNERHNERILDARFPAARIGLPADQR